MLAGLHYEQNKQEVRQAEVFEAARQKAKEWGLDLSTKKFGSILRDLGFRPGKNIKRIGKQKIRILEFDKRALKHIPPPEEEPEKDTGPARKLVGRWRDFSLLYQLLKEESDEEKKSNEGDRPSTSERRRAAIFDARKHRSGG
jgi:hypothetical protein